MQKYIFKNTEGNQWFLRNKEGYNLESPDIKIVKKYCKKIDGAILEIGCSNGVKLNEFISCSKGKAYGIDPSEKAIQNGKKLFSHIHLAVGTADSLPFKDSTFEIVIFGFCLYLIDRHLILRCLSEADRVLKNNGYITITDFDPSFPIKNKYHHYEGAYSFKMNYAASLLASNIYFMVEKISYSHLSENFSANSQERISTIVLYKDLDQAYGSL